MKASKRRAKNKKNAMIIGGVVTAVSAVAAGGVGLYTYNKKKSPKVTDTLSDVTDGE